MFKPSSMQISIGRIRFQPGAEDRRVVYRVRTRKKSHLSSVISSCASPVVGRSCPCARDHHLLTPIADAQVLVIQHFHPCFLQEVWVVVRPRILCSERARGGGASEIIVTINRFDDHSAAGCTGSLGVREEARQIRAGKVLQHSTTTKEDPSRSSRRGNPIVGIGRDELAQEVLLHPC